MTARLEWTRHAAGHYSAGRYDVAVAKHLASGRYVAKFDHRHIGRRYPYGYRTVAEAKAACQHHADGAS